MGVWLGPMKGKKELVLFEAGVTQSGWTATDYRFTNTWQTNTLERKAPSWTIGTGVESIQNNEIAGAGGAHDNVTGTVFSDAAADLTNYNSLVFDLSDWSWLQNYNEAYFFVTSVKQDLPTAPVYQTVKASDAPASVTLDISGLTGSYYIGVGVQAGNYYTATTSVKLVKITLSAETAAAVQ